MNAWMSLGPMLSRIAEIESAIADPGALVGGTPAPTPVAAAASPPTATAASAATSFASLLGTAGSSVTSPAGSSATAITTAQAMDLVYNLSALQSLAGTGPQSPDPASELVSLLGGAAGAPTMSSAPVTATGALTTSGVAYGSNPTAGNPAIVQIAQTQVGQTEQPFGSNNGPAIAMYRSAVAGALPGEPWCAQFASWVARQAGVPIGDQGQGLSAVSDIWSWAQRTGRAIPNGPGVVPAPGDLIVFGGEHVGIVTGVQANGQIDTVEGNYANQVSANVRSPSEATGYVNMGG